MFNRKKNNQKFSRVRRNHEDGLFHVDGMGISILCVIVVGGLAFGGYKMYQHKQALNSSSQPTTQQLSANPNVLSLKVKTAPKSKIFADGNQVGETDNHGVYNMNGIKVGAKLMAKFGKSKSLPVIVTKKDRNHTITFHYHYLSKNGAQSVLNNLYGSVSNLANNNDQTGDNGSLEDFYVGGNDNSTYKDIFHWAKAQYKSFNQDNDDDDTEDGGNDVEDMAYTPVTPTADTDTKSQSDQTDKAKNEKNKDNQGDSEAKAQAQEAKQEEAQAKAELNAQQQRAKAKDEANVAKAKAKKAREEQQYDSVHFVAHVKKTSLNRDGSVTVKYVVKNDFAGKKHDHVEEIGWTAVLKKSGSSWKIAKATATPRPILSYND